MSNPIDPYRTAAELEGWKHGGDGDGFIFHEPTWGSWKAAASWAGTDNEPNGDGDCPGLYDTWKECCECEGIDVTAPSEEDAERQRLYAKYGDGRLRS